MNNTEASSHEDIESLKQELRRHCLRAISSSTDDVDLLAIDLFASLVQQNETVIALDATKIIAEKFKSNNSNEVLQALNVLEECMSKCGAKFHNEVGKFRFLNELIRLVSPQYLGNQTVGKVRNKILDLLLLWTVHYPEETKIKEAYDMLISRGVHHELVKAVKIQCKSPINDAASVTASKEQQLASKKRDEMAEKLKGLLQSSNPADHKKANLLIQNMVKEKDRRTEMKIRRKLELREIIENATLLSEMLDQWNEAEANEDTLATIKDLHTACENLQRTLSILAGEPDDHEFQDETFEAIDLIAKTFEKYNLVILKRDQSRNQDLLSGLSISAALPSAPNGSNINTLRGSTSTAASSRNTLDELHEIFSNQASASSTTQLLEPEQLNNPLLSNSTRDMQSSTENAWQAIKDINNTTANTKYVQLPPLAATTTSVFNLMDSPARIANTPNEPFIESSPQKDSSVVSKFKNLDSEMTDLVSELKFGLQRDSKAACTPSDDLLLGNDGSLYDDEAILDHNDGDNNTNLNGLIESIQIQCDNNSQKSNENLSKAAATSLAGHDEQHTQLQTQTQKQQQPLRKPLSEINVDINTIMPHETLTPRILLDEKDGLKITLNFSRDRPRDDVTVLVITTTNHSSQSITNYQFDASVSRPCKLRLQPASGNELPGVKPFRPPSEDITQILLLANSDRKPYKLVCIISYLLGDDPDPINESLEITDLPYLHD